MLLTRVARSTAVLSIAGTLGVTLVRRVAPLLDLPELQAALPVAFVSIVGMCGSLIARPFLQALPALRLLPVRTAHLAMLLALALLAPGFAACAVASVVHALDGRFGLAIPLYVTPALAIVPALSMPWRDAVSDSADIVARWSAALQLVTWPFWAASFGSLALTRLLPSWFGLLAASLTAGATAFCYYMAYDRVSGGLRREQRG